MSELVTGESLRIENLRKRVQSLGDKLAKAEWERDEANAALAKDLRASLALDQLIVAWRDFRTAPDQVWSEIYARQIDVLVDEYRRAHSR